MGGYVYINRGLLKAADNEAQVAGVIVTRSDISLVAMLCNRWNKSQSRKDWALSLE